MAERVDSGFSRFVPRVVAARRTDGHGQAICEDRVGAKAFIERQKIFFVASAPPKGKINVSPKGLSSFRVLGDNDVAYLDCTGGGSETRAHLIAADDKRLTIMFYAFEGDPVILRLYGQGRSLIRGTPEYAALVPKFEEVPGARQIVRLSVDLVQTSCGMGVPLFDYKQERGSLVRYWTAQGIDNLRKYWGLKNMKWVSPTLNPRAECRLLITDA